VAHRPNELTLSPALVGAVLLVGFSCGCWFSLIGYGIPVAVSTVATLSLVQLTEDQRRRVAWRIRTALQRANIGMVEAAQTMGLDPADWSRCLTGERKLDLWRLEMLPDAFHQEHWPLIAADRGLPESFNTFLQILPIVTVAARKRSA
jgi:hypothetical protein